MRILLFCLSFLFLATQAQATSLFNVKDNLVQFLLKQVNDPGEFEIQVGAVTTPEGGGTRLESVSIADGDGVWMTVEAAEFRWNNARLLRGELEVDYVRFLRPVILRAPSSDNPPDVEAPDDTRSAADSWPRSPLALNIKAMEIVGADIREGMLPQRLQFNATGAMQDEGETQALRLNITRMDSVAGQIELSYQRDFSAQTLDLSLDAQEAAGGLVAALMGLPTDMPVSAEVTASGPDSNWGLNLEVTAQDRLDMRGTMTLGWSGVPLQADATVTVTPGAKLSPEVRAALSPQAQLHVQAREDAKGRVVLEDTRLTARDVALSVSGFVARDMSQVDVTTNLEVGGRLSTFLEGAAFQHMTLAAQLNGSGDNLAFAVDGRMRGPRLDALPPELLGDLTFTSRGHYDGALTLTQMDLTGRGVQASVSGVVAPEAVEVDYALTVPDIAPLFDVPLDGRVQDKGRITGPMDALQVSGRLTSQGMAGALTAQHTHKLTPTGVTGALDATLSQSPYGDGTLTARYTLAETLLTLSKLDVDAFGSTLTAEGRVNLDTTLARGDVHLDVPDLSQFDSGYAGRVELAATLDTAGGRQGVDLTAEAQDVALDTLELTSVTLAASTPSLGEETAPLSVDLTARDLRMDDLTIETLDLRAVGPQSDLPLTLTARGAALDKTLQLDAMARIAIEDQTQITLSQFNLDYAPYTLTLGQSMVVTVSEGATSLRDMDIRVGQDGRIQGDIEVLANGVRGDVSVAALDLTLINAVQPETITRGVAAADVAFDTRPGTANIDARVDVKGLQIPQAQATGAINLSLTGQWDGTTANVEAMVQGDFPDPIAVQATLPMWATNTITPDILTDQPFTAAATWVGDLEQLWQYAPLPEHMLMGQTDLNIQATGTLDAPIFSGGLSIDNGLYQNITTGTMLTDLNLTTTLSTQKQVNLTMIANDGADGQVRGDIQMTFDESPRINADLTATRAVLVRRDDVVARMDIALQAAGALAAPVITGDITILEAEVRLVNDLPPSVVDLGDVRIAGAPTPKRTDNSTDGGATLDIAVNAPGQIFIRGRGLDSEWATNLTIIGPASEPKVNGEFYAVRGYLDFLSKNFELETGKIVFSGGAPIDPTLDIVLARETQDLLGRIIVSGRASRPELSFTSTPSLPDDEILPRLIFGRSKQSLSAVEAVQLASGLATLTGGGGGPLDVIRTAFGFDALRIESDEEGNNAVAVGRYIQDGVYLGAKQALDGRGGAVVIELDITDEIKADVEVGQGATATSAGVSYEFDF